MKKKARSHEKQTVLKKYGTLNTHPEQIQDSLFLEDDFFDPLDLIQVKYEMLRRVKRDEQTISETTTTFGFSRLSFYRIREAFLKHGLVGLVPSRRGPKKAHKMNAEVMAFIEVVLKKDPPLRARKLKPMIEKHFDLTLHLRTIERAIARRKKKKRR